MIRKWMFTALLGMLLGATVARSVPAHDYKLGELEIGHPWVRATAKGQPSAGAFLTITNHGDVPDRLLSASCPIARAAELHSMTIDGGVMKMRPLPDGIDLPVGQAVELVPGGTHLMLVGPSAALTTGQKVPLTLTFEKAGTIEVELAVEKPGASAPEPVQVHDHGAGG